jgi:hypothetical protein
VERNAKIKKNKLIATRNKYPQKIWDFIRNFAAGKLRAKYCLLDIDGDANLI